MKRSKKYQEALGKYDKTKTYTIDEASKLVKELASAKFDESVEFVVRLNIDPKKADQQIRGAVVLPHGTGTTKKVLVIAKGNAAKEAKEAGADYVGDTDMIDKIAKENWFDFDVLVATPDMMAALGKIGKVLGPKGLMPNPKTGTVTMDTAKVVEEVKKGRSEYRTDPYGNVAIAVGKVSFKAEDLADNIKAFVNVIEKIKPSTVKGTYILGSTVSSTMGPGIKVDVKAFDKAE